MAGTMTRHDPPALQMNRDRVQGGWRQVQGIARQQWGRLTGDYLGVVAGKRQRLLGEVQAAHGTTTEADRKQIADWLARRHKIDPIHK